MPEEMLQEENPIYKFMKSNNLTDLNEGEFLTKYSAPNKAKEIHSFMVSNKLTDLDESKFYDSYLKKKDQIGNISGEVSSPIQSKYTLKKEAPKKQYYSSKLEKGLIFDKEEQLYAPSSEALTKAIAPSEDLNLKKSTQKDLVEQSRIPEEERIEQAEEQGLLLNLVSSLNRGFYKNFIGSPVKGLGTILQGTTKKVMGGEGFVSDNLIKFGDYFNNAIDELNFQDEEFKGTMYDQAAQALGQVASLILTRGLTGAVGKGAALVAQAPKGSAAITAVKTLGSQLASPTAVSAGLSMGQAEFDRAIQAGATDDQAFEVFYKNAAVGSVLETIPVMQFFKRFNKSTAGSVTNYIKTKGVAGLTGGIEEMTTEIMQQIYANKTAKDIYNINQDILDGVGSSGGVGFGVGFLLNAMGANAKILRKQGKVQEADVLDNQVKQYQDNLENPKVTSGNKVSAKDIVTQGVEIGTQKAVKNLDRDLANGVITPEQHQEGIVFAEKAAQVADKIPETVTGESRVKSVELLVERNDIKQANDNLIQQKQTTDEAYHAGIDEEIKANEERIKKIDSEVYNITKKPSKDFGTKTYTVDGEEVSQEAFEALQGKPIGTKEIVNAEVKPEEELLPEADINKDYPSPGLVVKKFVAEGDNQLLTGEDATFQDNSIERTILSGIKKGLNKEQIMQMLSANGHVFNLGNDIITINNYIKNRINGIETRPFGEFKENTRIGTKEVKPAEVETEKERKRREFKEAKEYEYEDTESRKLYKIKVAVHEDGSRTIEIFNPNTDSKFGGQIVKVSKDFKGNNEEAINKYFAGKNDISSIKEVKPIEDIYFNKLHKSEKFDDDASVRTYLGEVKGEKNIFYTLPNKGIIAFKETKNNTNRFSLTANAKNDTPSDIKNAFKRIEKYLPPNHELVEDKSISVDGLRVWDNFIKNGKYEKTGETNEIEITPIDKTNLFKNLKYTTETEWSGARFENKGGAEALARVEKYIKDNNLDFKVKLDGDVIKVEVPVLKYNPTKKDKPIEENKLKQYNRKGTITPDVINLKYDDNGKEVGGMTLGKYKNYLTLDHIYFSPEYRGTGLSKYAYKDALEIAKNQGYEGLMVGGQLTTEYKTKETYKNFATKELDIKNEKGNPYILLTDWIGKENIEETPEIRLMSPEKVKTTLYHGTDNLLQGDIKISREGIKMSPERLASGSSKEGWGFYTTPNVEQSEVIARELNPNMKDFPAGFTNEPAVKYSSFGGISPDKGFIYEIKLDPSAKVAYDNGLVKDFKNIKKQEFEKLRSLGIDAIYSSGEYVILNPSKIISNKIVLKNTGKKLVNVIPMGERGKLEMNKFKAVTPENLNSYLESILGKGYKKGSKIITGDKKGMTIYYNPTTDEFAAVEAGVRPNWEKVEEVKPTKTYQEALKEKQTAEKKQTRRTAGEKAAITKEVYRKVNMMDDPRDAEEAALRYLAEGGKIRDEDINDVYGRVKRAELNTGRREFKSAEVKSKDFAGGKEKISDIAHRIWEDSGQEISEKEAEEALMAEIGNNNTRLEAAEAYLEKYSPEYLEEKTYQRQAEESEAQILEAEQKVAETNKKIKEEFKEVVGKASKKAKENAKKDFVDRNFEYLKQKIKIEEKCPF